MLAVPQSTVTRISAPCCFEATDGVHVRAIAFGDPVRDMDGVERCRRHAGIRRGARRCRHRPRRNRRRSRPSPPAAPNPPGARQPPPYPSAHADRASGPAGAGSGSLPSRAVPRLARRERAPECRARLGDWAIASAIVLCEASQRSTQVRPRADWVTPRKGFGKRRGADSVTMDLLSTKCGQNTPPCHSRFCPGHPGGKSAASQRIGITGIRPVMTWQGVIPGRSEGRESIAPRLTRSSPSRPSGPPGMTYQLNSLRY